MANDNHFLGKFDLTGIPPAPRGVPQIEVTFFVDERGIFRVSAEDKGTGKTKGITIASEINRLPSEEIERMLDEAKQCAEEDRRLVSRTRIMRTGKSIDFISYFGSRQKHRFFYCADILDGSALKSFAFFAMWT